MNPGEPKFREPSRRLLKSPALDARGRDVWPLLHRSLREMKWDRKRRHDYRQLVFGSTGRMVLVVAAQIAVLCPLLGWMYWAALVAFVGRAPSGANLKSLVLLQALLLAVTLGLSLTINWLYLRRNTQRRIIPGLLTRRRCAACTYDLPDAPPASDGCTLCPECGSAWRLPAPPSV